MPKFVKKPIVIEAVCWDGSNDSEVMRFVGQVLDSDQEGIAIPTLEGVMRASRGDWIIRGVRGEYYPCKPDIFADTYDSVEH